MESTYYATICEDSSFIWLRVFRGGVFSPGAAFAKTSLVKQLNENGVNFEILEQGEIKRE